MPKKTNETNSLVPLNEAETIVPNVLKEKDWKSSDKYFLYRILGISASMAATLYNYNKDYGYKLDKKFKDNLNLRTRINLFRTYKQTIQRLNFKPCL
jgi:hypothetical protein